MSKENTNRKVNSINLFVYGTLRQGKSRNYVLKGLDYDVASLPDYKKISPKELGFPFIVKEKGAEVKGEVYYDLDTQLLGNIDAIEGEGNLYHRIEVKVITDKGEEVSAYTYYPSKRLRRAYI